MEEKKPRWMRRKENKKLPKGGVTYVAPPQAQLQKEALNTEMRAWEKAGVHNVNKALKKIEEGEEADKDDDTRKIEEGEEADKDDDTRS